MTMREPRVSLPGKSPEASADYRHSHVDRGGTYDGTLSTNPFDTYMAKWEAHRLVELVKRLYPGGIARYLDFACGTGRITQTVAPFAKESMGVDISRSMLEIARAKCPGTRFIEADATRELLDLGTFDVVTSFRFLGNAQDSLRREALTAIARLLRPGGHLIVNNHRNPLSISALLHRMTGGTHGMDLSYLKLRRLLGEHGFALTTAMPIGFWLFRSAMQASTAILHEDESRESRFGSGLWAPFAPDMILVAQRR